ncbi:type I methionyl aminopeptidase [Candidatus Kaiserbacteria bacterium RIFCSPHIGHO2_02_FULL_54_11b]|uniref:Methionine aminopeptidase n=2 Tax=Candidatus Kaiseribacteriota TaxID=1752734 RepID=A0A1F6CSR9_9BACT|nr:MAG: type I methionyl aminopeptidase [Candidatus Kaiserbacteria bacterium RIFCSPHIGHO2_01_FULL_54_36b]OGG64963.1 MAG: type I methionyl aminopeptidase [Candidatus Kaiserbacteria bacterium RIFCSPHIGHO2_02_FULL_54_11b]
MIVRNQEDIDALREGGRRLARHLRILSEMVAPGVMGHELEKKAHELVKADGDTLAFYHHTDRKGDKPYPSGLCLSVNDVIVHSPASDNGAIIHDGDVVCLDFGIKHKGLFTDHAVTIIAGTKRDPHDEELVRGTYEALAAGIAQARVGNTTGDIGYAVQKIADKYHFGYPKNLSGHGVGLKVHEEPHVPNFGEKGRGTKLVEGLVIAIEPMMTLGGGELFIDKDGHSYRTKDGSRTAHAEHTVLVTYDGPEILTKE